MSILLLCVYMSVCMCLCVCLCEYNFPFTITSPHEQTTLHRTWGALVKSGYRVSGMAKLQENPWGRSVSQADLDMKRYCCGLADLCDLYLKRRPPNDCSGYQPPVWSELELMEC